MKPTILLVGDSATQASTRITTLTAAGYLVIAILTPEAVVDRLRVRKQPVSLVITDHIMPGMSGSELARKIRDFSADLPILVISGLEGVEGEYAGLNVMGASVLFSNEVL
jgi:PleD family two-component response regulator